MREESKTNEESTSNRQTAYKAQIKEKEKQPAHFHQQGDHNA